jgi:hypothetical protein
MLRALVIVSLAAALSAAAFAEAARASALAVSKAVADPDAGVVHLTATCWSTRARCRGVLSMDSEYDGPVTKPRAVRLVPRRRTRVTLRLAPSGLAAAGASGGDVYGYVRLQPAKGDAMRTEQITLALKLSCRSGTTLASTTQTRVFQQEGFGVYACHRPAGRPAFVETTFESDMDSTDVYDVRIAEPYVAYVTVESYKCDAYAIGVYDLGSRQVVMRRDSSVDDAPSANCQGTLPIDGLVLRPSGAFAWVEGRQGAYAVRGVDRTGTHTIGTGTSVEGSSLRLAGPDSVAWLDDGRQQLGPLG